MGAPMCTGLTLNAAVVLAARRWANPARRYSLTTALNGLPVRRDSARSRAAISSSKVSVVRIASRCYQESIMMSTRLRLEPRVTASNGRGKPAAGPNARSGRSDAKSVGSRMSASGASAVLRNRCRHQRTRPVADGGDIRFPAMRLGRHDPAERIVGAQAHRGAAARSRAQRDEWQQEATHRYPGFGNGHTALSA